MTGESQVQSSKLKAQIGVVLGLLALGALLGWLVTREGSARSTLPDGTVATFVGVTSGTNHVQPGRRWARVLTHLPRSWLTTLNLRQLAVSSMPNPTEEPCVVAWFSLRSAPGPAMPRFQGSRLVLFQTDETGFEWPCGWAELGYGRAAFTLSSFPRRDEFLRLQLVFATPGHGLHGAPTSSLVRLPPILLRNPDRRVAPVWKPDPMPVSWQEGELKMELKRMRVSPGQPVWAFGVPGLPVGVAEAELSLLESGAPATNWILRQVTVRDSAGNRIGAVVTSPAGGIGIERTEPGVYRHRFLWLMASTEPAWKIQYELVRRPGTVLASEEQWWIRHVKVPAREEVEMLNLSTNLNGLELEALALVGEEANLPERSHDVTGQTILEMRCPRVPVDRDLWVAAFEPEGPELEHKWENTGVSYGFEIPAETPRIDLRLAVVRRHYAEFTVRPEFGPPAGQMSNEQ